MAGGAPETSMAEALGRIRDAGLGDDRASRRLADLCDKIGPRMSGSRQADAAVEQIAAALRAAGLNVTLQAVKVPHWVRGEEQAEMIEYPGRPAGRGHSTFAPDHSRRLGCDAGARHLGAGSRGA
jgi:hypothetical protein